MEHSPGDLETFGHPARVRRHEIFTSVRGATSSSTLEIRAQPQRGGRRRARRGTACFPRRELIVEGLLLEDEPDVAADEFARWPHRSPATVACPEVGLARVQSILMVVDFPLRWARRQRFPLVHREVDPVKRRPNAVALGQPVDIDGRRPRSGPGRSEMG